MVNKQRKRLVAIVLQVAVFAILVIVIATVIVAMGLSMALNARLAKAEQTIKTQQAIMESQRAVIDAQRKAGYLKQRQANEE